MIALSGLKDIETPGSSNVQRLMGSVLNGIGRWPDSCP